MACGGVSGGISNLSWCDSLHASLEDSRSNTEAATQSMAAARTAALSSQSDATTPRACKALHKARACSGDKGYDSKGRALPGREVNLRKRDTVRARRPGDMASADDTALLARVEAVMNGQKPV